MRPLLVLLLVLLVPGAAQAATLGREGTELVHRSAPGQEELHALLQEEGQLLVVGGDVTAGEGCSGVEVSCPLDGVTALRVLLGDGDDRMDLATSIALVVDAGPGDDSVGLSGGDRDQSGAILVQGGPGDDTLTMAGRAPGITLDGGDGDDLLAVALTGSGTPIDLVCGAGADRVILEPQDRAGDGCAQPVAIGHPKRVSTWFRSGRLQAPATGSVTLRRRTAGGEIDDTVLARRAFDAPAGPLRVHLKRTAAGRRKPTGPVWVFIRTRTASDRAEVIFASRLG